MTWTVKPLGEIATLSLGKMLDVHKNRGALMPYLANVNVRWGEFDLSQLREMRFQEHEFESYGVRAGDIIMCEGGEPGRCAIWKTEDSPIMLQKALHRIRASELVDSQFLFYSFLHLGRQDKFAALFTGSTIKHLPKERLRTLPIAYPSRAEQEQIAHSLARYDELIRANRHRMELLENAARELYREWFVRLRFPGYEHHSIVGGVPDRWEQAKLGDCAKFLSGGTPSKSRAEYWVGDTPWVSSGELTSMRVQRTSLQISREGAEAGSRVVPAETILAVVRGMSLAKDFRIGMTTRSMAFNQDLKAIVPKAGLPSLYLFHALDAQRDAIRDRAGEASHGTKKLDSDVLAAVPVLLPPNTILSAFIERTTVVHRQWDVLERQNHQLRAARNFLLPRLMRGELIA